MSMLALPLFVPSHRACSLFYARARVQAFCVADDILRQGVVGISDIIIKPGLINVDFADVQAIMGSSGLCLMGIGTAEGKGRARDAAIAALSSPLIDFPISQATGIVFTISGASDMTLQEVSQAAEAIYPPSPCLLTPSHAFSCLL